MSEAGLRARVKELKAELKRNSESAQIYKLKARIRKLGSTVAKEQSLRMKAESNLAVATMELVGKLWNREFENQALIKMLKFYEEALSLAQKKATEVTE